MGVRVGHGVGMGVGKFVGAGIGLAVGAGIGTVVGAEIGTVVGAEIGEAVGTLVGVGTGTLEGLDDGDCVTETAPSSQPIAKLHVPAPSTVIPSSATYSVASQHGRRCSRSLQRLMFSFFERSYATCIPSQNLEICDTFPFQQVWGAMSYVVNVNELDDEPPTPSSSLVI